MANKRRRKNPASAFMSSKTESTVDSVLRVPLTDIKPDPEQPRFFLPEWLHQTVEYTPPTEILKKWGEHRDDKFVALSELADSIAEHGLINPATVRLNPLGDPKYLIVTGERRWWAHNLLVVQGRTITEGLETFPAGEIKVALTAEGSSIRAIQLIENLNREDLNVVEKARGLWALRHEMSGGSDVLEKDLVAWKVVEEKAAMHRRHRTNIVATLKLCEEAQQLILEHNLPERRIRPVVSRLRDDPEKQIEAINQIIAYDDQSSPLPLLKYVDKVIEDLLRDKEVDFDSVAKFIQQNGFTEGRPWFLSNSTVFFQSVALQFGIAPEAVEDVWQKMVARGMDSIAAPAQELEPIPEPVEEPAPSPEPERELVPISEFMDTMKEAQEEEEEEEEYFDEPDDEGVNWSFQVYQPPENHGSHEVPAEEVVVDTASELIEQIKKLLPIASIETLRMIAALLYAEEQGFGG